jgi:hypothetical protein
MTAVALGVVVVAVLASARLAVALGHVDRPTPAHVVRLRTSDGAGVSGLDERWGYYQRQLERAAADPPSSANVLESLSAIAAERVRHGDGNPSSLGSLAADHHVLVHLVHRPPDRTRLSPRTLTELVELLEQL